MKSRSLHCLVCNQTPDQSHSDTSIDIFVTNNGELLAKRLERILDARLDSSSCHTRVLCQRCHGQVVEIEGYYRVIDEFRHLYHETAGLHKQEEGRPEALDSLIDTGLLELEKLLGIDHDDPSVQALLKAESSYRHETENDTYNSRAQNSVWKDTTVKTNSTIRDISSQEKHDVGDVKQDGTKGRVRKTSLRSRASGPAKANASMHKQTNSTVTHEEQTDMGTLDRQKKGDVKEMDKDQKDLLKGETKTSLKTEDTLKDGIKKECNSIDALPQSNGQRDFMMDTNELKPPLLEPANTETSIKADTAIDEAVKHLGKPQEGLVEENSLSEGAHEGVKAVKNESVQNDTVLNAKVEVSETVPARTPSRKRKIVQTDTPAKETMKLRRRLPRQASQQVSKATATEPTVNKTESTKLTHAVSATDNNPATFHNTDQTNSRENKTPGTETAASSTLSSSSSSSSSGERPASSNPYTCSTCQSGFKTRHDFYRHIRTCGKTSQVLSKTPGATGASAPGRQAGESAAVPPPTKEGNLESAKKGAVDNKDSAKDFHVKSEGMKSDIQKADVSDEKASKTVEDQGKSYSASTSEVKEFVDVNNSNNGHISEEKSSGGMDKMADNAPALLPETGVNFEHVKNKDEDSLKNRSDSSEQSRVKMTESNLETTKNDGLNIPGAGDTTLASTTANTNMIQQMNDNTLNTGSGSFAALVSETCNVPQTAQISNEQKLADKHNNKPVFQPNDGMGNVDIGPASVKLKPMMDSALAPTIPGAPKANVKPAKGSKAKGKSRAKGSKSKQISSNAKKNHGMNNIPGPHANQGVILPNAFVEGHQPNHQAMQQAPGRNGPHPHMHPQPLQQLPQHQQQGYPQPQQRPVPQFHQQGPVQNLRPNDPMMYGTKGAPPPYGQRPTGYQFNQGIPQAMGSPGGGVRPGMLSPRSQGYPGMEGNQQWQNMYQEGYNNNNQAYMQQMGMQQQMHMQQQQQQQQQVQRPHMPQTQTQTQMPVNTMNHPHQQQQYSMNQANMQQPIHAQQQQHQQQSHMQQQPVHGQQQIGQLQSLPGQVGKQEQGMQLAVHASLAVPQEQSSQINQQDMNKNRQQSIGQQQQQHMQNQQMKMNPQLSNQQHMNQQHMSQHQMSQMNNQPLMNQHQQHQMNAHNPINQVNPQQLQHQMGQQSQMNPHAMNQSGVNPQQQQQQHLPQQQPFAARQMNQHVNQQHHMPQQQQQQQQKDHKQLIGQDPLGMSSLPAPSQPQHPAARGHVPQHTITNNPRPPAPNGPSYPFVEQPFSPPPDNMASRSPQNVNANMYMGGRNQGFPGSSPPPNYPQVSGGSGGNLPTGNRHQGQRMPAPHHQGIPHQGQHMHDPNASAAIGIGMHGQHQVPNANCPPHAPHPQAVTHSMSQASHLNTPVNTVTAPQSGAPSISSSSSSTPSNSTTHIMQQQNQRPQQQLQQQQPPPQGIPQTGMPTQTMDPSMSSTISHSSPNVPLQSGFQPNNNPIATPGNVPLVQQGAPFVGSHQGAPGGAGSSHQMAAGVGGGGGGNGGEFKPPPTEGGFPCASALVNLAKTHSDPKPFKCMQCDASFFSADMLMEHTRVHGEDNSSAATTSRDMNHEDMDRASSNATPASSSKDLSPEPAPSPQPKKQRKNREPKSWRCAKCNITCDSAEDWAEHRRSHMGEKAYHCPTCGVAFAAKWYLTRHQRTHSGEKPHKCEICGKAFGRPDHLRKHMTIHTSKPGSSTSGSPTTSL